MTGDSSFGSSVVVDTFLEILDLFHEIVDGSVLLCSVSIKWGNLAEETVDGVGELGVVKDNIIDGVGVGSALSIGSIGLGGKSIDNSFSTVNLVLDVVLGGNGSGELVGEGQSLLFIGIDLVDQVGELSLSLDDGLVGSLDGSK